MLGLPQQPNFGSASYPYPKIEAQFDRNPHHFGKCSLIGSYTNLFTHLLRMPTVVPDVAKQKNWVTFSPSAHAHI